MIDRLKVIMEKEGLNPSQLADKLHIQRSGLSHILSGRNNPSLDFVKKVLTEFPEYDMEWFMFGDTNVNSDVYKNEQQRELSLFEDTLHSRDSIAQKSVKRHSALDAESLVNKEIPNPVRYDVQKKQSPTPEKTTTKKLIKVIMVYDDHTFEELTAE
jgi:transcriptional regulator with XRE-family HTH domain